MTPLQARVFDLLLLIAYSLLQLLPFSVSLLLLFVTFLLQLFLVSISPLLAVFFFPRFFFELLSFPLVLTISANALRGRIPGQSWQPVR